MLTDSLIRWRQAMAGLRDGAARAAGGGVAGPPPQRRARHPRPRLPRPPLPGRLTPQASRPLPPVEPPCPRLGFQIVSLTSLRRRRTAGVCFLWRDRPNGLTGRTCDGLFNGDYGGKTGWQPDRADGARRPPRLNLRPTRPGGPGPTQATSPFMFLQGRRRRRAVSEPRGAGGRAPIPTPPKFSTVPASGGQSRQPPTLLLPQGSVASNTD